MSERPLLMIPGPVEVAPNVLAALAGPAVSHVAPGFIATFGRLLANVRRVFLAPDGQPLVITGSGSLGWDMVACNCLQPGDEALVLSHGYFGDAFADVLRNQGVRTTTVSAGAPGDVVTLEQLRHVEWARYRMVCITHVDTSTAVCAPLREYCQLIRALAPAILIVVDGVAATGGELMRMADWDIDFAMTASQKALAAPAGLSVCVARPRALAAAAARTTPVFASYLSWNKWVPIMLAYEQGRAAYFATPAVHNIAALDAAVSNYLEQSPETRCAEHAAVAEAFRAGARALGLETVAVRPEVCAHTLTALKYPGAIADPARFRADVLAHGAIIAGGLHKDIGNSYFRVGHMGESVRSMSRDHVERVLVALERALVQHGVPVAQGSAVEAFRSTLSTRAPAAL